MRMLIRSTLNNILEHGTHRLDGKEIKLRFENSRLEQTNISWQNKVRANYYQGKFDETVPNPVAPINRMSAISSFKDMYYKLTGDRFTPGWGFPLIKQSNLENEGFLTIPS